MITTRAITNKIGELVKIYDHAGIDINLFGQTHHLAFCTPANSGPAILALARPPDR
jgi:hypothetical protein